MIAGCLRKPQIFLMATRESARTGQGIWSSVTIVSQYSDYTRGNGYVILTTGKEGGGGGGGGGGGT